MTTFQIPEGKVVDRIEIEGEGRVTFDVIYKEDKPKEKKRVTVLCETSEPTCVYLSNLTGELVVCGQADRPDQTYYVPMKKAEAGEFVVLSHKAHNEVMRELSEIEYLLSSIAKGNVTTEVAFEQVGKSSRSIRALRYFLDAHVK